jgi:CcmD family protein
MSDGLGWLTVVNLLLWTGLFLYMLRLQRTLRAAERSAGENHGSNPEVSR